MPRKTLTKAYMLVVIASAAAATTYSVIHLPLARIDVRFLALTILTVAISSRLTVRIPRISGHISVSDTFFFLTILMYGGEAAVLLAAAEALCSSMRFSRKDIHIKPLTIVFNSAMMACSTFVTFMTLNFVFGDITALRHGQFSGAFVALLCVMALVQYATNSSLAAVYTSLKMNEPVRHIWTKYYLWASITFFAGASAAGIIIKITDLAGFYVLIATAPIITIIYLTYRTYLRNVEAMAAAAKAEEVAAHAAEAERHVAELSHYIAEQKRIREQFSQIEKMSALGELASGVAHDFNNTLAGILGRAELMLRKVEDPEIRRGLEIIVKSAKDGAGTVKRIQDFARQRRDHDFEPVAVDQLLIDVNEITRPRWKDRAQANNVHINLNLQINTPASIMGDPSELREVLVNMVFNAVDAMPEGGRLVLSAEEVNDSIEIAVSDTGMGMSPEIRSRIFDPFFTTKGKGGMGLGLAVCYGIIQRHEGTIEIESEVGQGTTFRIRLPIAEAKPQTEIAHHPPTRLTLVRDSKAPRILVV